MREVVVVGGGLSGCWAAATAARAGAQVTLVRSAMGATAMSSGAVDFVPPAEARDPREWLSRLPRSDPFHPYLSSEVAVTVEELEAESLRLAAALGSARLSHRTALSEPLTLAAITGQVRLAGMVQATIAKGALGGARAVAVVGIRGLDRMHAGQVAAAIAEHSRGRVTAAARTVELAPGAGGEPFDADLDDATVARHVEADGGAEALGQAIAEALGSLAPDVVLLPAILGLGDAAATAARVEASAGVPVAELLSPPPSVPGWRLQAACERLAHQAGVSLTTGSVARVQRTGARVTALEAPDGAAYPCEVLVLATGKYIGGGVVGGPGLREPLLGLPVFVAGEAADALSSRDLTERTRFRDQPFNGAGVRTDSSGRPVDAFGRAVYENVLACGSLLAGVETTLRGGGLGVAAWTAARAGRTAATLVGVAAA